MIYETGLVIDSSDPEIDTLAKRFKELRVPNDIPIICDCANPGDIQSLYNLGYHAVGVVKPKIAESVRLLQSKRINYLEGSHLQEELDNYVFNEKTGQPIDKFNHILDFVRYCTSTFYQTQSQPVYDQDYSSIADSIDNIYK